MEKNTKIIIGIAIAIAVIFILPKLGLFAATGNEALTRTAPSTVNPGQTFTVTYTVSGTTGNWGAIIVDNVAGGCTFPAGAQLRDAMLYTGGNTKTISVTAPSTGSCTFSGYYQFDADASSTNFPSLSVNVCQPKTCSTLGKQCGSWSDGCSSTISCGNCNTGQQCNSAGQCLTCKTAADTDCSGSVSDSEILPYITKWINNQITDAQVIAGINAWVTSS